ncbi:hypothetical protein OG943_22500 [Amycolatopsis sp. NBC_00345]|uniref:hypothetical protein n=1 Tax=Amycolatopsis sp. NBC_00345 TaxID=2975955 RepID=UPI002E254295
MTVAFSELVSLAGAMVAQAGGASSPADGETAATVAALLTAEPRNEAQILAIVTVIVRDALVASTLAAFTHSCSHPPSTDGGRALLADPFPRDIGKRPDHTLSDTAPRE